MDFLAVLKSTIKAFDQASLRYALIGGFAMGLRGIQRATMDLDFILLLDDLEEADRILDKQGYDRCFRSENVSQYRHPEGAWGQIDILHAFRTPSLGMLNRAERIQILRDLEIPVVQCEDLIGLKLQALCNDPLRARRDWQDIEMIVHRMGNITQPVDWELIGDYLEIFSLDHKLADLKKWYGEAEQN